MMSMKNVQFSRPPTPFVHLRPKFFDPLDLGRQISNEPFSPNNNQSIKRKHNPRMTIICYQILPSSLFFQLFNGLFQKKIQTGYVEDMEFPEVSKK